MPNVTLFLIWDNDGEACISLTDMDDADAGFGGDEGRCRRAELTLSLPEIEESIIKVSATLESVSEDVAEYRLTLEKNDL